MTGDRLCHVIHQQVTSPCQMYRYVFTILRRILNIQMREDVHGNGRRPSAPRCFVFKGWKKMFVLPLFLLLTTTITTHTTTLILACLATADLKLLL